jgi:hypothetical protein
MTQRVRGGNDTSIAAASRSSARSDSHGTRIVTRHGRIRAAACRYLMSFLTLIKDDLPPEVPSLWCSCTVRLEQPLANVKNKARYRDSSKNANFVL